MDVVEEFRMELDTEEGLRFMRHGLNGAGFVCSCAMKAWWQLLHFIAVRVPNCHTGWEAVKEIITLDLNWKESSFTPGSFVTYAGRQSFHQAYRRAKSKRHLL